MLPSSLSMLYRNLGNKTRKNNAYLQTSSEISRIKLSFAHCSAFVNLLPIFQGTKPH